jgi:hypothetical protein
MPLSLPARSISQGLPPDLTAAQALREQLPLVQEMMSLLARLVQLSHLDDQEQAVRLLLHRFAGCC